MPIYAYKCASCGHAKDVLQKMSDQPLAVCPACGASSFQKQVTAAGFQLKGSGWYVTDFREGNKAAAPAAASASDGGKDDASKGDAKSDAKSETKSTAEPSTAAKPAAAPAPAAKPAAPAGAPSSSTSGN